MDNRKIKLIWDFKGPGADKTAEHHEKHLKEYVLMENLEVNITGHKILGTLHSMAYLVVLEEDMVRVRDTLKPHRGEIYEETPTQGSGNL